MYQQHTVELYVQAASAELRESAAEGLGELVDITSEETLKPFVVQITGLPMIPLHTGLSSTAVSLLYTATMPA